MSQRNHNRIERPMRAVACCTLVAACAVLLAGCANANLSQRLTVIKGARPDYEDMNEDNPGAEADITKNLPINRYTIVDLYSPYCGPCMRERPLLKKLTVSRRDIAVRSYDINRPDTHGIDWDSPLAHKYNVHLVPNYRIYGPTKRLIADGQAASSQVRAILHQEFEE